VVTTVHEGEIPDADVHLLGGLDDERMPVLAQRLREGVFRDRISAGAVVLAVNAGYQVLGSPSRRLRALVIPVSAPDVRSSRAYRPFLGPVITRPESELGLSALSGYESHHGTTEVGAGAERFLALELGHGNDGGHDGVLQGHIIGTYLHGPLLARNADLADLLIGWACGAPLETAASTTPDALRAQRITEDRADPSGWGGRHYGKVQRQQRPRRR